MSSTIKLQQVVNLASTHADLLPLAGVGGYTDEPALSLCNDVIQETLSAPNVWKFNRAELPFFVTQINKYDYKVTGAVAFLLGPNSGGAAIALKTASTPGVSLVSNVVTVSCSEPHNFPSTAVGQTAYMFGNVDATFNSVFTQNGSSSVYSGGFVIASIPNSRQFTFALVASDTTSGAPGITDWGWADTGTIVEINSQAAIQNTQTLRMVNTLPPPAPWLGAVAPSKACMLKDDGAGTLTFRLIPIPSGTIWQVNIVYQKKAPLKTALSNDWGPFPDEYSYVYRQGFLARCYRYIESPRSEVEDQKFQRTIQKAIGQSDEEPADQYIYPQQTLMDGWC